MISTLIALPYAAARLPLTVIDRGLTSRLPESSAVRLTVDRTLGTADRAAGTLLHHDALAARGTARIERVDALVEAARLQKQADERRAAAERVAADGRREAERKRREAAERVASGASEATRAEEQGKEQAARKAQAETSEKKVAADEVAARRTETVEQRKKRVVKAAEAKKKAARTKAKAGLDEAAKAKDASAEAHADAEVLDDLVEAKKDERAQD